MIDIKVNKNLESKTIAVLENGKLIETYEENKANQEARKEGNIYLGIVKDIVPGMQAAFIDIGTEKNSFIHAKDIIPQIDEKKEKKVEPKIKDVIKAKEKILVQIQKDSNEKKGARISTHIKLTGKYIILMPNTTIITISQKIENEKERERLINIVKNNLPQNMGAIIRTATENKNEDIIKKDLEKLLKQWEQIKKSFENSKDGKSRQG